MAVMRTPDASYDAVAPDGPAVDAVVFDLGGVLIDWDPRLLYRTLLPEEEVEAFLTEVEFHAWNHEQDAGRSYAEGVEAHAARFPHRRELLAAYGDRFGETLAGDIPGSVEVLADLRAGGRVRLLALTNWPAESFHHARDRFGFLAWFEGIVVSGEERVAKPDPRIFAILLERHRLEPARTVYIDDRQRNVDAAAAAGMTAVLFRDPPQLRADLVAHGALPAAP
jgi:2-haloacid dehalogenase